MVIDECPDGRGNALETERRNFQAEVRGGDAHQPGAAAASVDPTSSGGDDTEDDDADGDDFQLVSNRKAYRPRAADDVRGEQRAVRPVVTVLVSPRTLRSKKKLAAKARKLRRKQKREGLDLVDGTSGGVTAQAIAAGAKSTQSAPTQGDLSVLAGAPGCAANYNRWAPEQRRTQGQTDTRRFGDDFEWRDRYNRSPEKASLSYVDFLENLCVNSKFCIQIADLVARQSSKKRPQMMRNMDPRAQSSFIAAPSTERTDSAAMGGGGDNRNNPASSAVSGSLGQAVSDLPPLGPMPAMPSTTKKKKKKTKSKSKTVSKPISSSSSSESSSSSSDNSDVEKTDDKEDVKKNTTKLSNVNVSTTSQRVFKRRGKINVPTFDGKDYAVFKQLFMANVESSRWSETEKLQHLLNALRGPAKTVLTLLDDQQVTYDKLWKMLEDRYGASRSYTDVVDEMKALKRKPDQGLHDFLIDVKRTLRRTKCSDEERARLTRHFFVQGLPNREQRAFIDRKDKNRNDVIKALTLAQKYEQRHSTVAVEQVKSGAADVKVSETVEDVADVNRFYHSGNQGTDVRGENRYAKLERENKELRELLDQYKKQVDDVLKKQEQSARDRSANRGSRPWRNFRNNYRGNYGGRGYDQQRGGSWGNYFRSDRGDFRRQRQVQQPQNEQKQANQVQAEQPAPEPAYAAYEDAVAMAAHMIATGQYADQPPEDADQE